MVMHIFIYFVGTLVVLLLFAINTKIEEVRVLLLRESLSRLIGSYTLTEEDKAFMARFGQDK